MNKRVYEIGMLINPDLSQQEAEKTVEKVKDFLAKNSASVISEGEIVKIDLAYQIITKIASKNERFDEANFTWVKFEADASAVEEIKKSIDKIKKEIFRYLITKTVADDEATDKFNLTEDEENEGENDVEEGEELDIEVEEVEEGDTESEETETEENSQEEEKEEEQGVLNKIKNIIKK